MYYRNNKNELFFEPTEEIIKELNLKQITKTQFDAIWVKNNKVDNKAIEIAKAKRYLQDTDWVKSYELEHKLGIAIIPEDSNKWSIINKRDKYINMLNNIDS